MGAPKGNEYYKLRTSDGRQKKYNPQEFLAEANNYFDWCLNNPLLETVIQKRKISRDEEKIEKHTLPKMRPFSIQGLCNYLEITHQTFLNYEQDKDFLEVLTRVRGIVESQQFEGAAAGFLNAGIIARKLGLADKKEIIKKKLPDWMDESES